MIMHYQINNNRNLNNGLNNNQGRGRLLLKL